MPKSTGSMTSFKLGSAFFIAIFVALLLCFIIPPTLSWLPGVVPLAEHLVCPPGYHLDPQSLWASLCSDGEYNYTSVWYLYMSVQFLVFLAVMVITTVLLLIGFNFPVLNNSDAEKARRLAQSGRQAEAQALVEKRLHLEPYQAAEFVKVMQSAPPTVRGLEKSWQAANDLPEPRDRKYAGEEPVDPHVWLPAECPHCGASLDAATVEWLNDSEARCSYCSGLVKA